MAFWVQLAVAVVKVLPVTAYPDQLVEKLIRRPWTMAVWVPGAAWNSPPGWNVGDTTLRVTWCPAPAIAGAVIAREPVTNASPARGIVHRLTMRGAPLQAEGQPDSPGGVVARCWRTAVGRLYIFIKI
jgi:hypothetical protein